MGNLRIRLSIISLVFLLAGGCGGATQDASPTLRWYCFDEPSGAFKQAAQECSDESNGAYHIEFMALPADADQQREQLVRRLAAKDEDIDIIAMDVIWTAEFARAGWILPWKGDPATRASEGRLGTALESATYRNQLWAAPFTTNTQLLWYRTDRVLEPPQTWDELIEKAEAIGDQGTIQAQGQQYEGLTVFFVSLLASAGGSVLRESRDSVSLKEEPTTRALAIMKRLAISPAADPSLSTTREDDARLAFETGNSTFMINYTFVWPSANKNAPSVAANMGWSRWPGVLKNTPSRVTLGGINLGIGAYSRTPDLAFQAASCIASETHQVLAAQKGGLLPTIASLYEDPRIRAAFPFAEQIRETLRDAVLRPKTPVYNDVSLAISRTLHPMRDINPERDVERLRSKIERALRSKGLL
jgi:multiple sugar transport system substrate-binding protein